MLTRLGFAGRLSAILMLALLALWALGAGVSYVTHSPVVPMPGALPLPHQMAAIVELLETSDAERRKIILNAADSDTLQVTLADNALGVPEGRRRLKALEWLVGQYVSVLGPREVIATIGDSSDISDEGDIKGGQLWRLARRPLRVAVALKGGGYAVFETKGELARRLFGLPPGYWLGALELWSGSPLCLRSGARRGRLKNYRARSRVSQATGNRC